MWAALDIARLRKEVFVKRKIAGAAMDIYDGLIHVEIDWYPKVLTIAVSRRLHSVDV